MIKRLIPAINPDFVLLESYAHVLKTASKSLEDIDLVRNHEKVILQNVLKRIENIYTKKYKTLALFRGEIHSGKTSVLSAIVKEHLFPISRHRISETTKKHVTALLYDKNYEVPALFKTNLHDVYNENYGYFGMDDKDLTKLNATGIPEIFEFLKKNNAEPQVSLLNKVWTKMFDKTPKMTKEKGKPSNEKEVMYVVKMRMKRLETDLTEEELSRLLLIELPGSSLYQEHNS
jgi:hypothetical protein